MIDLTPTLEAAESRKAKWTAERFRTVIGEVQSCADGIVLDWDSESGEDVARFLIGSDVVAFVFREIPLAVVVSKHHSVLSPVLKAHQVSLIAVEDFESAVLRVEPHVAKRAFQSLANRISDQECTSLSVMDLWWGVV